MVAFAILLLSGCVGDGAESASVSERRLRAYLDASAYPALIIEIDYMESVPPRPAAVDHLVAALKVATQRSDVRAELRSIPDPERPAWARGGEWTSEELDELAQRTADLAPHGVFSSGDTAVVHVLYIWGSYANGSANGIASNRAAFLFQQPSLPTPGTGSTPFVERAVLLHEVGHLLGLVNDGVAMTRAREDPSSRHHSTNPDSVMYKTVDAFDAFAGRVDEERAPPADFDKDDLADLRAFAAALTDSR